MSKVMNWLKTGSLVVSSAVGAAKAVMDYRKYRREQQSLEHTRRLQERAWQQVMDGELAEARVGDVLIRAPDAPKRSRRTPEDAAASDDSAETP